jgi:hypothetical protein
MKGRSRRGGLGSLAGHPSKVKLATALRELGYPAAAKRVESGECEAYGRKVFCYPCFKSFAERREIEAKLEARGFKVDKHYGEMGSMRKPGDPLNNYPCAAIAVSYFKASNWDE